MRILETPTAYLSPLQHLAKVGKELLVKITKTRITNISDVKIEPEPMITSTTTHNISIENICTKDKRKDYDNNFINNQIQNFPNDTIVIFTDGSCQNNPGPTGVGSLVFKDRINNPLIKFAKAVSKFSMNYHGELEAILLSLKYIRTINLIGIKKVHIFTDTMSSIQAITSTKQSFNDIIEEIKRISNELKTLNFAIALVFSHIDIKFNEEADKLAKVEVKLASKYHQTKELTIPTAKKANKNHSTEIWGIPWARQSHAKYKNFVPKINSASLKHRNLLQKIAPALVARKIFRLKTGHNLLPANRCKIDKSIDPLCPTCKKTFDEYHLFFSCHDLELYQTNLL